MKISTLENYLREEMRKLYRDDEEGKFFKAMTAGDYVTLAITTIISEMENWEAIIRSRGNLFKYSREILLTFYF